MHGPRAEIFSAGDWWGSHAGLSGDLPSRSVGMVAGRAIMQAYDASGKVVSHTHLPMEAIRALQGYATRTANQLMVYSGDRIFLAAGASDMGTKFCSKYMEPTPEVVDDVCAFMEMHDMLPTRATLMSPKLDVQWATIKQEVLVLEDETGTALATCCQFRQSVPDIIDITPNSIDKGVALRSLLDSLGLSSDTAVALGDGENDAPLLKGVHMGVSMGNGMSLTKAAARCVTRHVDDDGWSTAVRRFALAEKICACDLHDECCNS